MSCFPNNHFWTTNHTVRPKGPCDCGKIKDFYAQEDHISKDQQTIKDFREALQKIADQDYRGNRQINQSASKNDP